MNNTFYYKSPIGVLELEIEKESLISLNLVKDFKNSGEITDFVKNIFTQLDEYFLGKRKIFDINYSLRGTDFQKKVWNELVKIPYGETVSYKEIAERIGSPKAMRAVGGACNKNKILIVVPCHRVIGQNGNLTGFALGLDIKNKLLDLEN